MVILDERDSPNRRSGNVHDRGLAVENEDERMNGVEQENNDLIND